MLSPDLMFPLSYRSFIITRDFGYRMLTLITRDVGRMKIGIGEMMIRGREE